MEERIEETNRCLEGAGISALGGCCKEELSVVGGEVGAYIEVGDRAKVKDGNYYGTVRETAEEVEIESTTRFRCSEWRSLISYTQELREDIACLCSSLVFSSSQLSTWRFRG